MSSIFPPQNTGKYLGKCFYDKQTTIYWTSQWYPLVRQMLSVIMHSIWFASEIIRLVIMYRQSPQLSTCPTVQQSLCVGISSSHTVSCLRRRSNFVWWWSRRRSRCSVKPTKPADIKHEGFFLQEGHKNNENNSDHNNGKDSCYTIVNRCWYSEMLSPRGQSGLEAKILASASVSASKLWPRPWPQTFGLGLASICSRRTSSQEEIDGPICLHFTLLTTGHHTMIEDGYCATENEK